MEISGGNLSAGILKDTWDDKLYQTGEKDLQYEEHNKDQTDAGLYCALPAEYRTYESSAPVLYERRCAPPDRGGISFCLRTADESVFL